MSVRVNIDNLKEFCFNNKDSYLKEDECGTKEFFFAYNYASASGWYKELLLDSFKIGYGTLKVTNTFFLDFDFEGESIESNFVLEGQTQTSVNSSKQDLLFKANEHNLYYSINAKGKMEVLSPKNFSLEINFSPNYFMTYLPEDNFFDTFKKLIENKQSGLISTINYPITPKMIFLINEIINCKWKGSFRKMFLESKVLELLLEQTHQILHYSTSNVNRKQEFNTVLDKLHAAKDYLHSNFKSPLSLKAIAREIGTNEFTLKKGFKSIFGTTVFSYLHDIKMNEAHKMLLEKKCSVKEVSDYIGYKNAHHFTAAFKKKYGMKPSELLMK